MTDTWSAGFEDQHTQPIAIGIASLANPEAAQFPTIENAPKATIGQRILLRLRGDYPDTADPENQEVELYRPSTTPFTHRVNHNNTSELSSDITIAPPPSLATRSPFQTSSDHGSKVHKSQEVSDQSVPLAVRSRPPEQFSPIFINGLWYELRPAVIPPSPPQVNYPVHSNQSVSPNFPPPGLQESTYNIPPRLQRNRLSLNSFLGGTLVAAITGVVAEGTGYIVASTNPVAGGAILATSVISIALRPSVNKMHVKHVARVEKKEKKRQVGAT